MKSSNSRIMIIAIVMIALIVTASCVCQAQSQYFKGVRVGVGNVTVNNGNIFVKDTNAAVKFSVAPATGNTTVGGTLAVTGAATIPIVPIVNEATATRTVTSADFGKIIACSFAGATTITLPDPSAGIVGATFQIAELVDQTLTIVGGSVANNNQIIAHNVLTSDSVAFSTAGHKIGAMARVTCISATKWLITNASGCTMTPEAAD